MVNLETRELIINNGEISFPQEELNSRVQFNKQ